MYTTKHYVFLSLYMNNFQRFLMNTSRTSRLYYFFMVSMFAITFTFSGAILQK